MLLYEFSVNVTERYLMVLSNKNLCDKFVNEPFLSLGILFSKLSYCITLNIKSIEYENYEVMSEKSFLCSVGTVCFRVNNLIYFACQ